MGWLKETDGWPGFQALFLAWVATAGVMLFGQVIQSRAQENQPADPTDLPSAHEVIERYINRIGGYEVLESRASVHIVYEATKNGQPFDYEIFIAPGKYYSSSRYESGRWYERGINRGVAWTRVNGVARQLEGAELQGMLSRHQHVCAATHWVERCQSIRCVGTQLIRGRLAFRLIFVDQHGIRTVRFFDCGRHLLVRSESTEMHGSKQPRVVRDFFDYRKVRESLVPMRRRIVAGSKIYQYTVMKFEVDAKIPRSTFDLPPTIERNLSAK